MHEKIHGLSSRGRVDRKWRLLAKASRRISNWTWHGVGYNSNRSLKQLFLIECPDQAGIVLVLLCFKMNCFRQKWKSFHQLTDAFFSVSSKISFARATVRTDGVHTLGVDVTHRNCWITFVHVWKNEIVCVRFKSQKEGVRWIIARSWIHQTNCFRLKPKFTLYDPFRKQSFPFSIR